MCPSGVSLGLTDCEDRSKIAEKCRFLLYEFGERSRLEILCLSRRVLWSVAEKSLFGGVGMEIKVELECRAMGPFQLESQLMQGSDFRKDIFVEFVELPIQVSAAETGPEVSCHYSVRIEHGDDVEGKVIAQHRSDGVVGGEEANKTLEDEGGVGLAWMDAASDEHHLLLPRLLAVGRVRIFLLGSVRDCQQRHIEPAQGLCHFRLFHAFGVGCCHFRDEFLEAGVGVGYGVCEVYGLVLFPEVVLELQLEGLPLKSIAAYPLNPADFIASFLFPLPALAHLVGLEAVGVKVLLLAEVADVELHLASQVPIVDLEVVPAGVSAGVGVAAQEEVELVSLHPYGHVEVAALELRIEVDVAGGEVHAVTLAVVAHPPNGLSDCTEGRVVAGSITPKVLELLVQLHGVGSPRPQKDQSEPIVAGQMRKQSISVGIGVGERQRT